MIDILAEFEAACEDLGQFQEILRQTLAKAKDPAFREHLQQLDSELGKALAEARETFPKAVAEMDADIASTQQAVKEGEEETEALEKKLAELESLESAPPAPPAPLQPLDAPRWETMRRELLDRFGPPPVVVAAGYSGEAVVDMPSSEFQTLVQPAAKPAVPPPPPSAKKATQKPGAAPQRPAKADSPPDGEEMLDMTSGAWKVDDE